MFEKSPFFPLLGLFLIVSTDSFGHAGHSHAPSAPLTPRVSAPPARTSTSQSNAIKPMDIQALDQHQSSKKFKGLYSGNFVGPSVSDPLSTTHYDPEGQSLESNHLLHSFHFGFSPSPKFELFVAPKFDQFLFGNSKSGSHFVVENPLLGAQWHDVYQMGAYRIKAITTQVELPLSEKSRDAGMVFGPGIQLSTGAPLSGRLELLLDAMARMYFYKGIGDADYPSESPDVVGYTGTGLGWRFSDDLSIQGLYELSGYYFRNRPDFTFASDQTDLRFLAQWRVLAEPLLTVTPYILLYPGTQINGNTSALGIELTVVAL